LSGGPRRPRELSWLRTLQELRGRVGEYEAALSLGLTGRDAALDRWRRPVVCAVPAPRPRLRTRIDDVDLDRRVVDRAHDLSHHQAHPALPALQPGSLALAPNNQPTQSLPAPLPHRKIKKAGQPHTLASPVGRPRSAAVAPPISVRSLSSTGSRDPNPAATIREIAKGARASIDALSSAASAAWPRWAAFPPGRHVEVCLLVGSAFTPPIPMELVVAAN